MSVLALDIGGTKLLAALVEDGRVVAEVRAPTDIREGPDRLLDAAAALAAPWRGRYSVAGAAVTGLVRDGRWRALNTATLDLVDWFPLAEGLADRLGTQVRCANDAHAAAWGEYQAGSGEGRDMVFLTVSTGIGGGIVLGGRLLEGLAGSFGQLVDDAGVRIEDRAAGRWMAAEAAAAGHPTDAVGVFGAASSPWAARILDRAIARIAGLCRNVQLAVDPERIVIGGSIGLARGFLDRIAAALDGIDADITPRLVPAALGARAGVIGVAALAATFDYDARREKAT
jgi:predicted NBD/HSP70 family sugar kinase